MPLNSSGQISLGGSTVGESVNLELSKLSTALVSMNDTDLRTLFGVASGQISLCQGYGKSSGATIAYSRAGQYNFNTETFSNPATTSVGTICVGACNSATGTPTRGYFAGGCTGPANQLSSGIARFEFSTLVYTDLAAKLVQGRRRLFAADSDTRGYTAGGTSQLFPASGSSTQIDGIIFSSDAQIDPAAALAQSRQGGSNVEDSTRGFFMGGHVPPAQSGGVAQIDGITFSTEASLDPAAALVQGRQASHGASSSTRGYVLAGATGGSVSVDGISGYVNQIDALNFSNLTMTDIAAALTETKGNGGSTESATNGYVISGGVTTSPSAGTTSINRINFSTEAASTAAAMASSLAGSRKEFTTNKPV